MHSAIFPDCRTEELKEDIATRADLERQAKIVVLEVGFVTNDEDNKSFDKNLDDYAEAIAEIIFKYIQNKSPTE